MRNGKIYGPYCSVYKSFRVRGKSNPTTKLVKYIGADEAKAVAFIKKLNEEVSKLDDALDKL